MRVQVLLFGVLKDIFSGVGQSLEMPADATVETLLSTYFAHDSVHWALLDKVAIAVNLQYAPRTQRLTDGDEVALLPPVSGGGAAPGQEQPYITLTREPVDVSSIVEALKRGEDGAVVVFEGIVRNHTKNRRTLFLVYEAYEAMGLELMRRLASDAIANKDVRAIAIVHRLGRLEVGETSILIAVAAAHRPAAFEVCRDLIDTIKKTVPIWKKEHFEDGASWSDGEAFPPELTGEGIL